MTYPEAERLPISALQHLLFCERQCALIHLEGLWAENWRTVQGQHLHETAHEGPDETREGIRIVRGLDLNSSQLGLTGKADVVEFHPPQGFTAHHGPQGALNRALATYLLRRVAAEDQCSDRSTSGHEASPLAAWTILPIEYKRGRPKKNDCDRVQLCAQALCLEEMLEARIDRGILFYGKHRRRTEVVIDDVLREKTVSAAARLHALIRSEKTPRAVPEPKCESCSLKSLCLPVGTGPSRSATRFVNRQFNSVLRSTGPTTTFMEDL